MTRTWAMVLAWAVVALLCGCQRSDGPQALGEEAPARAEADEIRAGDTVRVLLKDTPIKVGRQTVATVDEGTTFLAEEVQEDWVKVTTRGETGPAKGWVQVAALARMNGATGPDVAMQDEIRRLKERLGKLESTAGATGGKGNGEKPKTSADGVVRARGFEVVDADGRARAKLHLGEDGSAGLWLHDNGGVTRFYVSVKNAGSGALVLCGKGRVRQRVALMLTPDGGGLVAVEGRGGRFAHLDVPAEGAVELSLGRVEGNAKHGMLSLGVGADESSGLTAYGAFGKEAGTFVGITPEGRPKVLLLDGDRKERASLALRPDGSPYLWLLDSGEEERVVLDAATGGMAALRLYDATGAFYSRMACLADGHPHVYLAERKGKDWATRAGLELTKHGPQFFLTDEATNPRAAMGVGKGQPARLVLTDEAGKVVWKAP